MGTGEVILVSGDGAVEGTDVHQRHVVNGHWNAWIGSWQCGSKQRTQQRIVGPFQQGTGIGGRFIPAQDKDRQDVDHVEGWIVRRAPLFGSLEGAGFGGRVGSKLGGVRALGSCTAVVFYR